MTKKQFGIIFTLLALIITTALLAQKLNKEGLNDPTDLGLVLSEQDKEEDAETISKNDFFIDARSTRERNDASTVQSLNDIIDNENTTEEQKAAATTDKQRITMRQDKEKAVESGITNKGYEDALCEISEDGTKATIYIKTDELSEQEGAVIQEVVQNASGIIEVSIEVKK